MRVRGLIAAAVAAAILVVAAPAGAATFTPQQKSALYGIAQDTWQFYGADVDPVTHLPLDNLGPGSVRGDYTSAANVGVYLWAIVAARDLGLINTSRADQLASATLNEVAGLKRYDGFMYQWYDTNNGNVLLNPGQGDCNETAPAQDNCWFVSAVDNGWYATGLIEVKQALPAVRGLAESLLKPMDFSIFYDNRPQTDCDVDASLGGQPTGQMYGGYYVDQGPAGYHNGALYSDPRIAMYIGMGRHQMPGDVWWRTWRTDPPQLCSTDPAPAFSPGTGYWHTYTDPQSGKQFPVWEGHYTYPDTSLTFIPTFAGGMFEGLMANLVVPETTWGPHSFGLADVRWAQVQVKYATQELGYPVWGMSPSSTADDTGNYGGFGAEGQAFGSSGPLAWCTTCATGNTVSPHASAIALPVLGSEALSNLEKLKSLYPGIYPSDGGFYDAVNPVTGEVGHRRLVLDQSMIMAAVDDALEGGALQKHFASDPESCAAKLYLGAETMSLH
ncbi:MAG TPA: glucoamylase family protein [Solirubrobacteraceae bacterium]|nr:glucoamylase family protein [Solirubrobacteraceae bacterium]